MSDTGTTDATSAAVLDLARPRGGEGEGPHPSPAELVGRRFLEIAEDGFLEDYSAILAEECVYLVPGRPEAGGLHRGRAAVVAVLGAPPGPGVRVERCTPTELVAAHDRAVAIVRLEGRIDDGPFSFEVAFHLQLVGGEVVAITEYSGDQYQADRLLGEGPTSRSARTSRRFRRWLRALRRGEG